MSQFKLERDREFTNEAYIYRINTLDGGLVTSFSPRLLEQARGFSTELLNITLDYPGILMKRKGTEDTFSPAPGEVLGLIEFERTFTDETFVLIPCVVGNYTYLYYWDGSEWVELKTSLPKEEPDFKSFADQLAIAYPNYPLFTWNGEEIRENMGEQKAKLSTFFIFDNNDMRFIARVAGKAGNYIQIEIVKPEEETEDITITTEGEQEEEDPLVITITPAWRDVIRHQMMIYLGGADGGTFKVGDPFSMTDLPYDVDAEGLKDALENLYGEGEIKEVVTSAEPDIDFIITFDALVRSHMRTDFALLENATDPKSQEHREYEDALILSTAEEVKTAIEANLIANDAVEVELIGDGSGRVLEYTKSSLTGGYDAVKGAFLEEYRTRLLLAGDPGDPNLLRASHTGDPSLWDPFGSGSNAFELYVGPDDGTHITGILGMGDGGVLIGKRNSTYALFGYTRDNMIVDLIDSRVGVVNNKSMGFVKPYAIYLSHDGIYRYESGQVSTKISLPIQDIFDGMVDHERLDESVAYTWARRYVLSLPDKNGGSIVLVYYVDHERWARWDQPDAQYFSDYTEKPTGFIFLRRDSQVISKFGMEERTDNGEIFRSKVTTIEIDAELPERIKYFGELYIIFRTGEEEYNVDVSVALDGTEMKEFATQETIFGEPNKQKVLSVTIGKEARFLEVSIVNESSDKSFYPLSIVYTYRPLGVL